MSPPSVIRDGRQILREAGRRSGYKGFKSQPICFHCLGWRLYTVGLSSKMRIDPEEIVLSYLATSCGRRGLWATRKFLDRRLHLTATPTQLLESCPSRFDFTLRQIYGR